MKKIRLLCLLLTLLLFVGCAPVPAEPSGEIESPSASASGEVSSEPVSEPSSAPVSGEPVSSSDTSSEPVTPPVTPVFELPELPEIGEYDAVTVKRISPDYIDHFTPSDDYGMLYPYAAAPRTFAQKGDSDRTKTGGFLYGLCTADGTVVTDPIYSEIEGQNGYYLLWQYAPDAENYYAVKCICIPADGSSVRQLPVTRKNDIGQTVQILPNGNILCSEDTRDNFLLFPDGRKKALNGWVYLRGAVLHNQNGNTVLDLNGNLLFQPDTTVFIDNIKGERMVLKDGSDCYLTDLRGNRLLPDNYISIRFFKDKIVTVAGEQLGECPYTVTVRDDNLKELYRFGLPGYRSFSGGYFYSGSNWYTLEGKKCGPFEPESTGESYKLEIEDFADLMKRKWQKSGKTDILDMQGNLLFTVEKGRFSIRKSGEWIRCFVLEYDEDQRRDVPAPCYRYSMKTGELTVLPQVIWDWQYCYFTVENGIYKTHELSSGRFLCATPEEPLLGSTDAADGKALLFYTANGVTCSRFADGEIYMKIQSENG